METSPTRVLIVDDELPIRLSLAGFLADDGFDVLAADSAEDALAILARETFTVAVVDMRLPGMDGNSLVLRAHEMQPWLKFVVHTGSTDYQLPQSLTDIGVSNNHVFRKPVLDLDQFADSIRELARREETGS